MDSSRRKYFGGELDLVHQQPTNRAPAHRVVIWNPNRTSIHEVCLGEAESPEYDVTDWVSSISYSENITWENNDDAIASNCVLSVIYDEDALPIEMTEKTWLDGTPVRIYQGDRRIKKELWIPIFTGVVRGVPSTTEYSRSETKARMLNVTCVDRAEKYLNSVVTARAYETETDVGKAAVETAIEWMYLDRREIMIGYQDYAIAHTQSQLVDVEVLKGVFQILFTVGKKPKFNGEGFLVAADTDLDKPPIRRYQNKDHIVEIRREQILSSVNNSVRLLGIDDELTAVVESTKRLAHGNITSGFFEDEVRHRVYFSENDGKENQGRRAKNTYLANERISSIGAFFGEGLRWAPNIEDDGFTVFWGQVVFNTGYDPAVRATLTGLWAASQAIILLGWLGVVPDWIVAIAQATGTAAMIGMILSMTEVGHVYWEVHGQPFQNVYQQLCSTAQLSGILTEDIKEIELRNDWLYDIGYMRARAKELLRRELIKGWSYQIHMIDDPFIEVDDIIEIESMKFYITSIRKNLLRPGDGKMICTAWRIA
ncbi:MAG: hypothetical protein JSW58_08445 [Candidatus Latescibacterota bacterium]|nr:MAG: hypothetical protein JSW58_08445 [Candidatus Latescibacterota bacterium]